MDWTALPKAATTIAANSDPAEDSNHLQTCTLLNFARRGAGLKILVNLGQSFPARVAKVLPSGELKANQNTPDESSTLEVEPILQTLRHRHC